MFFDFRFWRYFANQHDLLNNLGTTTMRGFKKRVWMVGFFGLLLFVTQELWGMNTQHITSVFSVAGKDPYVIARLTSLIAIMLWAVIYMSFHFFGIAFLLNRITGITLSKLAVLQLYVVGILLLEKALLFIIFMMLGVTTPVSLFSFGPLAATFIEYPFVVYFFNQLTIFTALIIAFQIRFIRSFTEIKPLLLFFIIIGINLIMALIIATVGLLPLEEWFVQFVEGGALNE